MFTFRILVAAAANGRSGWVASYTNRNDDGPQVESMKHVRPTMLDVRNR